MNNLSIELKIEIKFNHKLNEKILPINFIIKLKNQTPLSTPILYHLLSVYQKRAKNFQAIVIKGIYNLIHKAVTISGKKKMKLTGVGDTKI
ncbi:hypothetical protein BpHYR1_000178 [Brachionus plicatilis]|uniref:Uncharacterized protein n=1 Tax=Brachionus plicatilis TaxID=10195 RepID=A0A3M7R4A2_BRAPC|nr:hypothetical protein BpHYR1_000178 [Brachionus plicatilis]